MTEKDGGPAFPSPEIRAPDGTGICAPAYGMTLRDYFAGQALAGLTAKGEGDGAPAYAYWLADAMLLSRQKETQ